MPVAPNITGSIDASTISCPDLSTGGAGNVITYPDGTATTTSHIDIQWNSTGVLNLDTSVGNQWSTGEWQDARQPVALDNGNIIYQGTLNIDTDAWANFDIIQGDWSGWVAQPKLSLKESILKRRDKIRIDRTAEKLLHDILCPEEWLEYRRYGSVRVVGSLGGIYEVGRGGARTAKHGWSGNVYQLGPAGDPLQKLCVHAGFNFPIADEMVGLILALRTNEQAVLDKANRHRFQPHEKERVKLRRIFQEAA